MHCPCFSNEVYDAKCQYSQPYNYFAIIVGQRIQLGDGFGNQNVECGKALADLDDIQNIGDDKG